MDTNICLINLPEEVIAKILTFLETKELLCVSLVCLKLNDLSKSASFWKNMNVTFKNKAQLLSFCDFFSVVHYLQRLCLQIDYWLFKHLDDEDICAINLLFANLNRLQCLEISYLDLEHISLPPKLKHLSCLYDSTRNNVVALFESIRKCPNIEFLRLEDEIFKTETRPSERLKVDIAGKNLLQQYEKTLSALYFCQIQDHCANMVTNCLFLRELGVRHVSFENSRGNFEFLKGISRLPHLQVLYVESWEHFSENFNLVYEESGCKPFKELRHLTIQNCSQITKSNYSFLMKVTKLGSFCLCNTLTNSSDLCQFLSNCQSLKRICLHPDFEDVNCDISFIREMVKILSVRSFESLCIFDCEPKVESDFIDIERVRVATLNSLEKCNVEHLELYKCNC